MCTRILFFCPQTSNWSTIFHRSSVQLFGAVQRGQGLSGRLVLPDGCFNLHGGRQEESSEIGREAGRNHEEHDSRLPNRLRLFRR